MTMEFSPVHLLNEYSIAIVPSLYSNETIVRWNSLIDPIIQRQKQKRRYVSALELQQIGILEEMFNSELQSLIFTLKPDAELYHCHVYEIESNQVKPHISADNKLNGWHRDVDCKHQIPGPYVQHISLFVYLSDVAENGGYFEVSNKRCFPFEFGNQDQHFQLIGEAGMCFLFDRKSFHRASTNSSDVPRRVLKISFQSRELFNHKQQEEIFKQVRKNISSGEPGLRQLFGDKSITATCIPYIKKAKLPEHQLASNFSPYQNFIRVVRDAQFILRRLGAKLSLINDKKVPKPKILIAKDTSK